MEREQADRSGRIQTSDTDTDTNTETDTVSEPDLCCNSEETESDPEHLETRRCGALLTLHTEQKGKQGGEQESENDSKDDKMRNNDEHEEEEEEEDEMVNSPKRNSALIPVIFNSRCWQTVRTGVTLGCQEIVVKTFVT